MENTFSLKRFGKYFAYDLNKAAGNAGLSVLIIGIIPVITYVFFHLATLVFSRTWMDYNVATQISAFCVSIFVLTMTIPVKLYGSLTDKRAGSDWLLIPASMPEKFVSMILILGIVVPVTFLVLFFGSDWLLSVLDPTYGKSLITGGAQLFKGLSEEMDGSGLVFTNAIWGLFYFSIVSNLLTFNLGGIYFKKAKVGKTLLVLFAISSLFSMLMGTAVATMDFGWIENWADNLTPEKFQAWTNSYINISLIVSYVVVLGLTWWRLKTIKH